MKGAERNRIQIRKKSFALFCVYFDNGSNRNILTFCTVYTYLTRVLCEEVCVCVCVCVVYVTVSLGEEISFCGERDGASSRRIQRKRGAIIIIKMATLQVYLRLYFKK